MDFSCRVCLQVGNVMVSVFEQVEKFEMSLCNLLQIFGALDIERNDDFSKYLCEKCTQELLLAAEFRKKCKKSQELLLKMKYSENREENLKISSNILATDQQAIEFSEDIFAETNFSQIESKLQGEIDVDICTDQKLGADIANLSSEILELENELLCVEALHHVCHICNASFQQPLCLQRHIENEHTTPKLFNYQKCNLAFDNEKIFKHDCLTKAKDLGILKQKVNFSKNFICHFCNKKLQSEFAFKMHQHTHTGDRPFHCNICQNRFRSRSALVSHQSRHVL